MFERIGLSDSMVLDPEAGTQSAGSLFAPVTVLPLRRYSLQYDSAEWEPTFLRQAKEFLRFPLLPREASE